MEHAADEQIVEPPPTYTPTELVSMWSVLVGLVKFGCCVISFFMMHLGFPLFDLKNLCVPKVGVCCGELPRVGDYHHLRKSISLVSVPLG